MNIEHRINKILFICSTNIKINAKSAILTLQIYQEFSVYKFPSELNSHS